MAALMARASQRHNARRQERASAARAPPPFLPIVLCERVLRRGKGGVVGVGLALKGAHAGPLEGEHGLERVNPPREGASACLEQEDIAQRWPPLEAGLQGFYF